MSTTLGRCLDSLTRLSDFESGLDEVGELLTAALAQTEEAAAQLRQLADRVDFDPQRLDAAAAELSAWVDLARKHRCRPEDLPERHAQLIDELAALENAGSQVEALSRERAAVIAEYDRSAGALSAQRTAAAGRLATAVTRQMQELGLPGGHLEIAIDTDEIGEPSRFGRDRVEFRVSTNPGQPARALSRVASGGELSRISLAIGVVTAAVGGVPTMIFDEVDVGIGGGVAEIVGQRLRELAGRRQVLCITHLPQVAAQGQHHLTVRKRGGDPPSVTVRSLDAEERVDEVARMLGGVEITDQTVAHAADMLERAAS